MKARTLSRIAGISYLIIFFAAIFANFFVLESLLQAAMETIAQNSLLVRLGILAFLITAIFDVVVAWALFELYPDHPLSRLSTYFRVMHAAVMGIAVYKRPEVLGVASAPEVLGLVNQFNNMWLIGLFFFGIHLILLGKILQKPKFIVMFLMLAGLMYMVDTTAHFLLENYDNYKSVFLALVAIPSILGEMSLALWLLIKGGKQEE